MRLDETIELLVEFKKRNPAANKAALEQHFAARCNPLKHRSVFVGDGFSMRFCEANTASFSNTVLSLSTLRRFDTLPVVICIVRPDGLEFRLANATFLKRVSHSSHQLREDNIRGSFLGHDIVREYEGVRNSPEHFDELFAMHSEFIWEENLARLVEATNSIVARPTRFEVTKEAHRLLMASPVRAAAAEAAETFRIAEQTLIELIDKHRDRLLQAATLDNVNLRGNTIEQILTRSVSAHRLDDLTFDLGAHDRLIVDIKTKLLDRVSAPKAYNIDKMLRLLSDPANVFCFFFIGLDANRGIAHARLVSPFDPVILKATRILHHWAGRASRGVTQLTGNIAQVFADDYRPAVDIVGGQSLLKSLIER